VKAHPAEKSDRAEIERLVRLGRAKDAKIERLRAALEPFANAEDGITHNLRFHIADDHVIYRESGNADVMLRMGDFRRAAKACR
jgi:hypothetical protein